jgi:hypothetical protein
LDERRTIGGVRGRGSMSASVVTNMISSNSGQSTRGRCHRDRRLVHDGFRPQGLLELDWGPVGQRGVQALTIVDLLDKGADGAARVEGIAVGAPVDLLLLSGSS